MKKSGIIITTLVTIGIMGVIVYFACHGTREIDYSTCVELEESDETLEYFANRYFNDPSTSWYKGDLNTKKIKLVLAHMDMKEGYYYNGVSRDGGHTIYLNKQIIVNNQFYDTESLIKARKFDILESVLVHEMIHSYIYFYYPYELEDNQTHGTLYKSIERSLNRKGYRGFPYID